MARMTNLQLIFIEKLGLGKSNTFDASGLKKQDYRVQMRDLGKLIAYGVSPCKAKGHALRTRAGHCVQCNPRNLGFLLRYYVRADVYVAWSSKGKLAKIGFSKDANERAHTLREWRYGGQDDWEMKLIYEVDNAANVEKAAQDLLLKSKKQGITYMNGSIERECSEVFACPLNEAKRALLKVLSLR